MSLQHSKREARRGEWRTPKEFWDVVDAEFHFGLDVDNNSRSARTQACISAGVDALSDDVKWVTSYTPRVWCNPPYSDMLPWVERAGREAMRRRDAVVCLLAPLSAAKWAVFASRVASETRILHPRLQFQPPPGITASSNSGDNVLYVFRHLDTTPGRHIWYWEWKEGT